MAEDYYSALMMRRALPTTQNLKAITEPGIYPVDAGNATAPNSAAGTLEVFLPTTSPKIKFIASDWNVYTLVNGSWQGFGTAAIRNVADESNPGALVPVGYKGNFSPDCNHGAIDFATYPFVVGESLFIDVRTCANNPPFLAQDYYYINVIAATNPAASARVNRPLVQFIRYSNSTLILAVREDDGTNINWRYFRAVQYDANNSNVTIPGGLKVLSGSTELAQNAIYIRGGGNKHLWFHNASGEEVGLVYASDDKTLHLRAGQGPSVDIQSDGHVTVNSSFGATQDIYSGRNISNAGLIQAGNGLYDTPGVRVYSPNNPPPSGKTTTGSNSAYYTHDNGQVYLQCIGGVYSNSTSNPDVNIYLPAAFPNGILGIGGSFSGSGGSDKDSWWTATPTSASSFNLHTQNCSGTFSFVVAGY